MTATLYEEEKEPYVNLCIVQRRLRQVKVSGWQKTRSHQYTPKSGIGTDNNRKPNSGHACKTYQFTEAR